MSSLANAPAAVRNREAILEVLRSEFRGDERVLEIGSGTGQHAVYFAKNMPQLHWQTSDLEANHKAIRGWTDSEALENVSPPIVLDVAKASDIKQTFDAIFSANTAHIMSASNVEKMLNLVANLLLPGGCFYLYGPFRVAGKFTSESNEAFHSNLQTQNSVMGIRDLEWIDELARGAGLEQIACYAMPANNMLVGWRKETKDKS